MNADQVADDSERAARWLGRTINNKYVVQAVVGHGGMAVVYAVKHRNGKRFALKMLHRELSLNQFIRQRFVREGYVANRVEHDGAVAVLDDDITDDGSAFLVMELLHGVTLERLWEASGDRLPLECVLAIAEQLLDVLAAAHAQSIVHRDLKPANVFVTRHGVVKILDFGIARLREGDGNKTETGTTLGTPLFMPPEQAAGRSRDVDARTDLWSVGATMFSLLTGQYVHDGENAAQVLIASATTPARSLATVMPGLPDEVVEIVDRALSFHNEDRWDSASAMRTAIMNAQESLGVPKSREFLGNMVRGTAPGLGEAQSTPVTTPAGTDRTERIPPTPVHGSPIDGLVPSPANRTPRNKTPANKTPSESPAQGLDVTKRSTQAPVERRDSAPTPHVELTESSARAVTSPTESPSVRSRSRSVVSAAVIATAAAVIGGVFAVRFVAGPSSSQPPSTSVPAVVAAPSPATPTIAPAKPVEPTAGFVPTSDAPTVLPALSAAVPPVAEAARPASPTPKWGHTKVVRGAKTTPSAAAAPPATPSVAPPAAPPTPPAPAASSPAPAPAPGKKPVLDRTSPF